MGGDPPAIYRLADAREDGLLRGRDRPAGCGRLQRFDRQPARAAATAAVRHVAAEAPAPPAVAIDNGCPGSRVSASRIDGRACHAPRAREDRTRRTPVDEPPCAAGRCSAGTRPIHHTSAFLTSGPVAPGPATGSCMSEYVLEVLDGESAGQVISLDKERLSLGRRPGNDVVLKDEKASGNHAEVVREGDAWVLRDLGSRNGTRMDGRDVKEVGLSPGDVFQVGLTRIGFRRAEDPSLRVPAAEGEGAEGFAMHRVDQARLQRVKGGRGMLPMVAALLVVAGAGVWVWLRYGGDREPGAPRRQREVVSVPGNLLANDVAAVDRADAFDLGGGGADFVIGSPAHSGANALTVERGEGAPFAVARLREPLRVIADDTLEVSAHVSCSGGAQVALRVL